MDDAMLGLGNLMNAIHSVLYVEDKSSVKHGCS